MIVNWGINSFKYLTDNSKELSEDTTILYTSQNKKYIKENYKTVSIIELYKYWNLDSLKVIGITGTNGKTTTAAIIYSIFLNLNIKVSMQGTRGFFILNEKIENKILTTPSILNTLYNMKRAKDKGCEYFIMEVSSHAIKQNRIENINFALKIITNVTSDHLDYHKTVEEYKAVKSKFFEDETPKLLNKDDIKNIKYNSKNAYSYGVDEPATYSVKAFSLNYGIEALITHLSEHTEISSMIYGTLFNLYNLIAGVGAVSILTGIKLDLISKSLEDFGGVSGRMEIISKTPLIIVDFAHTVDGMMNVLESFKNRDIVVVFGAGGDRDKTKREKMGRVAEQYCKKIYITNDNPRFENQEDIIRDILKGIKNQTNTRAIPQRDFAISEAIKELETNEVLLILGKGDEEFQEIEGKEIEFNDKIVINNLLA